MYYASSNRCYRYGKWVIKDGLKAFEYYRKFAEIAHSYGIYLVSVCYVNGIGVVKDEYKAFINYQKSANANETNEVGCCFLAGSGVKKDERKAFIYYQKSAEMGNALGTNNLFVVGTSCPEITYMVFNKLPRYTRYGFSNLAKIWLQDNNVSNFKVMLKCMFFYQQQRDYFGIQEFYRKMTRIEQLSHPENLPYGLEYHGGYYQSIPVGRRLGWKKTFIILSLSTTQPYN
ncbi:hypothetical protein C2G38_2136731 [Gigaspora rosea]|uniref:HCP-like protein n=1 Tax=Gigaspora rosea TaxID=44941 RepID=A0A397W8N7_9GLOM|nr:hypothetical protein C2G38_2136731 [Gigaspora rosea]